LTKKNFKNTKIEKITLEMSNVTSNDTAAVNKNMDAALLEDGTLTDVALPAENNETNETSDHEPDRKTCWTCGREKDSLRNSFGLEDCYTCSMAKQMREEFDRDFDQWLNE